MSTLALVGIASSLAELDTQAHVYLDAARAANTHRAYRNDLTHFAAWCATHELAHLPAEPTTVAMYLTAHASVLKASTLQRRLVSISQAHRAVNLASPTTSPTVTSVWKGIRREIGTAQVGKSALLTDDIRAMVAILPEGAAGARDRALVLVGFAGAFRRGELVALDTTDVEITREGAVITLRRSKTDQEGAGVKVGVPWGQHTETCPVTALTTWMSRLGHVAGPIFRSVDRFDRIGEARLSDRDVARIVKRTAQLAGLNPDRFAGHSLRAGLATSAAMAGVEERTIMAQTRHKSVIVARRYIRDGSLFRGNAAASVGL